MTTITVNAGSTSLTTDNPQFAAVVLQMISEETGDASLAQVDGIHAIGAEWPDALRRRVGRNYRG